MSTDVAATPAAFGLRPVPEREKRFASTRDQRQVVLLPDPEPREVHHTIISVDDHVIEPADIFDGRLPSHLQERAPRIVEDEHGSQLWEVEGVRVAQIGLVAVAGRAKEDWNREPTRFDEMRPGCFDADQRVRDMDLGGVYASLCFPSDLPGFAGRRFNRMKDKELGLACVRAWNDWMYESWFTKYPDRFIPCQIPWLNDVEVGIEEIHRNAARGFKGVTMIENPVPAGLPSLHSGHWDRYVAACAETETVVCLHGASSGWTSVQADDAPVGEYVTNFIINAMTATVDWLWSGLPYRYPDLKIVMSESGISWVPAIMERLDYVMDHSLRGDPGNWYSIDLSPSELLKRNFWFCTLDDPVGISLRDKIGVDHILLEVDYPHSDGTWPDTQAIVDRGLSGVPDDEARKICSENAASLFRHALPSS